MSLGAVITADIVNSTKISLQKAGKLIAEIKRIIHPNKIEFYRGDSFQAVITQPENAFKIILQIRSFSRVTDPACDIKASIGIGEIKSRSKKLSESIAEAFILSGRAFDKIKDSEENLIIISTNSIINYSLEMAALFTDYIFKNLTPKQAEVFIQLLANNTQKDAAKRLKRSPSTVNQHLLSGGWHELVKVMSVYEKTIQSLI